MRLKMRDPIIFAPVVSWTINIPIISVNVDVLQYYLRSVKVSPFYPPVARSFLLPGKSPSTSNVWYTWRSEWRRQRRATLCSPNQCLGAQGDDRLRQKKPLEARYNNQKQVANPDPVDKIRSSVDVLMGWKLWVCARAPMFGAALCVARCSRT